MRKQRYELVAGKSAKFWDVMTKGSSLTTTYGRLGSKGQSSTRNFSSPAEAKAAAEKLIKQKIGKGYRKTGARGTSRKSSPKAKSRITQPKKKTANTRKKKSVTKKKPRKKRRARKFGPIEFPLDELNELLRPEHVQIVTPRRLKWGSCCASCASSAVLEVVRKRTTGAVYWHDQDQEDWESGGFVNLRYSEVGESSPSDEDEDLSYDEKTKQVGEKLIKALGESGIDYLWSGDPDSCIIVTGCVPREDWRGKHFVSPDEDYDDV